jgi:5-methylcytosine-specific restriction protein A
LVCGDEEELQTIAESEAKSLSDSELYEKAKQRSSTKPLERVTTTSTYVRDVYIAEASKRKANGICQLCEKPAPFNDKNGNPYLESHHIIWLSEGGSDELSNTVALCPNCHKKMHIVNGEMDVQKLLKLNI